MSEQFVIKQICMVMEYLLTAELLYSFETVEENWYFVEKVSSIGKWHPKKC